MPHLVIRSTAPPGDDAPSGADIEAGSAEHYVDAALYDFEYRRRRADVRFYRSMARALTGDSGHVLELACGSGRITSGLLRDGHTVVGLDISQPMLARASSRIQRLGLACRKRALLVRADMRRFALGRKFPLIIMAFNSFEHLYTRPEAEALLANVRAHLAPKGTFIFDVQNPDLRWLCRDPQRRWSRTKFKHPITREPYIYTTNHEYDPISQIILIRLYYQRAIDADRPGKRERVVKLSQRKYFPAELETLVAANGFRVHARYGDFEGEPLHADAENQVLVCRRQS